ncbi:MAG TPA: CHAD domain-containing protein [Vicinamibacterales bacterium]|nr:CHAD domain-containing protein [Vicinamibacterales bacterium]
MHRVAAEELERALRDLHGPKRPGAIHRARKGLKKLRAVLRLVRSSVEPAIFARENAAFRDLGRRLSVVRDADLLVEVVKELRPERAPAAAFDRVVARSLQHRRSVHREFFEQGRALADLRQSLSEGRSRLRDWIGSDITSRTILKGLERSYRRAGDSFEAARRSENDERWHEWRKRSKDVWYHLRLIEGAWPPVFGAVVTRCGDLADRLGDDHDLVVIGHRLAELAPGAEAGRELSRLRALITRRREKLQAEARDTGRRLFDEKPRAFRRRVGACWREWRR